MSEKMIKVLIVDDERIIRFGITSMIHWSKLGVELVGQAASGEEGLRLFKENMPDIVLTDIRMSEMDGIEMMTQIKQIKPDVKFAILSGYPDFSYAKQAIDLGASAYLLKSDLMPDDIEEILQRMIREIQEQRAASKMALEAAVVHVEDILGELCLGSRVLRKTDISAREADLFDGGYRGLCIGVKRTSLKKRGTKIKLLLAELKESVKNTLSDYDVMTCQSGEMLIALVFGDARKQAKIKAIIEEWIQLMSSRTETAITVGISGFHRGIGQIHSCYEQACLANNKSLLDENGVLTEFREMAQDSLRREDEGANAEFDLSRIEKYFKYSDAARLSYDLDQIFEGLKEQQNYDKAHVVCIELVVLLNKCIGNYYPEEEMFEQKQKVYQEYQSMDDLDEIAGWMKRQFLRLLEERTDTTSGSRKTVRDVQKYIKENYADDITITQLSEMVHLNKSYLGNLFARETGQSINEYIIQVRMEKAKELLLNTPLTAKSVAEKVGYEDERYFYKVFKKATGYTAKEFAKKFKQNEDAS